MKKLKCLAGLILLLALTGASSLTSAATRRGKKVAAPVVAAPPTDWGSKAAAELATGGQPSGAAPTAATVRAEAPGVESIIERSALRFTFLFEPYQPQGNAHLASGDDISYSSLPTTVLGQLDMRWLPFDIGSVSGRPVSAGGYLAAGYSRQNLPLVAPSGFRYDDVALNSLRLEGGLAFGVTLSTNFNLETRVGAGRIVEAQTSKYSDVVASYNRPYLVGAVDLAYYLNRHFAWVLSVARRTPMADGSGSIAFDPLTVSGGFLVQVR